MDRILEPRATLKRPQFEQLRALVYLHSGICLADGKCAMMDRRLQRRLRALGLRDFDEYLSILENDSEEMQNCVEAISTNLTSFFRENHHFQFLEGLLAGAWKQERELRLWSAGCSTGEEAYSLAVTLAENAPERFKSILATDISKQALDTARQGIYPESDSENLSRARLQRWFFRGRGSMEGKIRVRAELRRLVSFRYLNLQSIWPMNHRFHMIFCRNVMIYFDRPTQVTLVRRFSQVLLPGGYLVLGHSESLLGGVSGFRPVAQTVYQLQEDKND